MAGERGRVESPTAVGHRRHPSPSGRKFVVKRPVLPQSLKGEARDEWHRIVPELETMNLLATVDRALLIRYCTAWANWCEADGLVRQTSLMVRNPFGGLVKNPMLRLRMELESDLEQLGRQLGLSPVARIRAGLTHERVSEPVREPVEITAIEQYRQRLSAVQ